MHSVTLVMCRMYSVSHGTSNTDTSVLTKRCVTTGQGGDYWVHVEQSPHPRYGRVIQLLGPWLTRRACRCDRQVRWRCRIHFTHEFTNYIVPERWVVETALILFNLVLTDNSHSNHSVVLVLETVGVIFFLFCSFVYSEDPFHRNLPYRSVVRLTLERGYCLVEHHRSTTRGDGLLTHTTLCMG